MLNMRSKHWKWVLGAVGVFAIALRVLVRARVFDETTCWIILGVFIPVAIGLSYYTRQRYRDFVHEPLRPNDLPRDTYAAFNAYTPEFMQLGCGLLGDFRLAYSPEPVFARYFSVPDERVRGEISDFDGMFVPSFATVFSDGQYIETAVWPEEGHELNDNSKLWFLKAGNVGINELYRLHRLTIDTYQQSQQVSALRVTPENLGDISQYGHRLVWWEKGELPRRLGEPQIPSGELIAPPSSVAAAIV